VRAREDLWIAENREIDCSASDMPESLLGGKGWTQLQRKAFRENPPSGCVAENREIDCGRTHEPGLMS
jgi:hypothetical protein